MATFAAPGPPPREGLVWHDETHRWRNPDTGETDHPAPDANHLQNANDIKKLHPGVTIRTDASGKPWVIKSRTGRAKAVQNESAAASLASLAGVDVPPVHHVQFHGQDTAAVPLVPGTPLTSHATVEAKRAAMASVPKPQIDRHALFDYLIGSHDPNDGNYLIHNGSITAIDKEQSLSMGLGNRTEYRIPFMLAYAPGVTSAAAYTFDPETVKDMAARGESMADKLDAAGRKSDANGIRRRVAVLQSLPGDKPVSAAELDAAGKAYDKAHPSSSGLGKLFGKLFGK